jgi:glycosyltransferase involved in cell wall biosynthesis
MSEPIATPRFTVCIPCLRAGTIDDAIDSVVAQTWSDWELLIVMQGEDPVLQSRIDQASARDRRIRGVRIPETGVSLARNAGVRAARSDTVVFLDDDCEARPDWLERIAAALDEAPDIGMVAGSLVAPPGPRWPISVCPEAHPTDRTVRPLPDDPTLPDGVAVVTANLAVRRWVWEAVGPFDERLGAGSEFRGGEDLDLLLRAVRRCVPIRLLPDAVVDHSHGRRYGVRAVFRMVTGYGYGQGAVAAKMTLTSQPDSTTWNGRAWRRRAWRDAVLAPLRTLRVDRVAVSLPRLIAFELAYRRAVRTRWVDESGLLSPARRS